jgi:hypothetical protein
MIWIAWGRWNHSAGRFFTRRRIWRKGYIWTPFVVVERRYST